MKECNAKMAGNESALAVRTLRHSPTDRQYPAYIGLDVHKESIAVAVARAGREAAVSRGEIANQPKALVKLVERLNREFEGEVLLFCYEAGPCGNQLNANLNYSRIS